VSITPQKPTCDNSRSGAHAFAPRDERAGVLRDCFIGTFVAGEGGFFSDFRACGRCVVANHLGIDLSKEWAISGAYLQNKTIPEIMGMGERFGIFKDEKANFKACKRTELINIILKSGIELTGKVPNEILNQ
jgi:hypothetical protein